MTSGYPARGKSFGGNKVRPIRWWPWIIAAALAGLGFGCPLGSAVGGIPGMLVGTGSGAFAALMTIMFPLKLRDYRLPQPAALRVAPDGLHVHLAEHGRWRPGSYLHPPWPAIARLTLIDGLLPHLTSPSLQIHLAPGAGATIVRHHPAARRLIDTDGHVLVQQIGSFDLCDAVEHYSAGRFRISPL